MQQKVKAELQRFNLIITLSEDGGYQEDADFTLLCKREQPLWSFCPSTIFTHGLASLYYRLLIRQYVFFVMHNLQNIDVCPIKSDWKFKHFWRKFPSVLLEPNFKNNLPVACLAIWFSSEQMESTTQVQSLDEAVWFHFALIPFGKACIFVFSGHL